MSDKGAQKKVLKKLEAELTAQKKKNEELSEAVLDLKKNLEETDDFVDIVKALEKVPSSNIGIVMLQQEKLRKEKFIDTALPEKDAAVIKAGWAGYLGSRGDKEAGISPGAPMDVKNTEAVNLARIAIYSVCKDKKLDSLFKDWKLLRALKWSKIQELKHQLATTTELDEKKELRREIFNLMEAILTDSFDITNVPIDDPWIRDNCPEFYEALITLRNITITRTLTMEEASFEADKISGVVKAGGSRKQPKTSMEMKEALLELADQD